MTRAPNLGVIGAATAEDSLYVKAVEVGAAAARLGWTVICGGRTGVMEAACKGASQAGGDAIAILPGPTTEPANQYATHVIATNMGHARNVIIAHSARALVAIGGREGTLSEIAVSLKLGKPVFGIDTWDIPGVVHVDSLAQLVALLEGLDA